MRKIVKASPAVRTLAARMGVDLAEMKGSGEGGRVLKDDIIAASTASDLGGVAGSGGDRMGQMDRDQVPAVTRVEFGRTRKVMYRALGEMGAVPHFG
jgi:2-oxoisovalerate dehydrogenase E2 component (dihydrolipoyl transacylase)